MPHQPTGFPAPPTASELWWVAVENAIEPSGGWLILADPKDQGARKIQTTFQRAGISILAAVSADDLAHALENHASEDTLALRLDPCGALQVSHHATSPAQTLLDLRMQFPEDRILLVESQAPARELATRMQALVDQGSFEGIRMDLRDEPRGQGAWGLALVRSA